MISCVLACLLGHAGITLSLPATFLKDALAEVSKQIPEPIYVEGKLANEVICLRVQNMPIGELEKNLAKVSTGEWVLRDGKKILTLSGVREKQQYQDVIADRRSAIEEAKRELGEPKAATEADLSRLIQQAANSVGEMRNAANTGYKDYQQSRQRLFKILDDTPSQRLLLRLIQQFRSEDLAQLDPGLRICFSTSPNQVQRAFPFDVKKALAGFRREQALLKKLMPEPARFDPAMADDWRYMVFEAAPDSSELLLIVQTDRTSGLPSLHLVIADAEGRVQAVTGKALARTTNTNKVDNPLPDVEIPLSEHQQSLAYALTKMGLPHLLDQDRQLIRVRIDPALKWLSRPEENEPLADMVGPSLISVADQSRRQLIALLPDRALWWVPTGKSAQSSELGLGLIQRSTGGSNKAWDCEVEDASGVITVKPRLPWQWRDERINRRALGRVFRSAYSQGALTVLESAVYLGNCGSSTAFEFWSYDRHAGSFGEPMQGSYSSRDLAIWYYRDMLKLLGGLSEQNLRRFLEGGEIGLAQLGRERVERCLFGRDHYEDLFADQSVSWLDRKFEDRRLSDEVWEKLPNGAPATFRLTCRRSEEEFIQSEDWETRTVTGHTPEAYGFYVARGEWFTPESVLRLGKAIKYEFRFEISPTLIGISELGENTRASKTTIKSLDDLPEAMQKKVRKAMEDERRRQATSKPTNTGAPPP